VSGEFCPDGLAADTEECARFAECCGEDGFVVKFEDTGLEGATEEDAEEDLTGGGAAFEFDTGEGDGEDFAIFDGGDDDAEAIERVGDLVAGERHADDGARGIGDGAEVAGEFGIVVVEEASGGVGFGGDDDGIGGEELAIEEFDGPFSGIGTVCDSAGA
jgi:hypothetical protein